MKTVYYNTTTSTLYDVDRGRELPRQQYPWIRFRENIDLKIIMITGLDSNGDPVIDTSLDESLTYEAAIDKDYSTLTTLMAKTLDAGISVTASTGTIIIALDANTTTFLAAVDNKSSRQCTLELQGNDGTGLVWSIDFPINCKGTVNDGADAPGSVITSTITRVANIAALPSSPADMQHCMVTSLYQIVTYDAENASWIYANGTTVEAGDES